jgi:hypothetical protein
LSAEPGGGTVTTTLGRHLVQEDFELRKLPDPSKNSFVDAYLVSKIDPPILQRTVEEGTASQVAAAFDPALANKNGSLIVFCQPVAVEQHAKGQENEEKLWKLGEKSVGQNFS